MTEHYDDITPEQIGMAVLGRLGVMVAMRHKGPTTSLSYTEVDDRSAEGLVADLVALASGHGEHHRPGCAERLRAVGMESLAETIGAIQ